MFFNPQEQRNGGNRRPKNQDLKLATEIVGSDEPPINVMLFH